MSELAVRKTHIERIDNLLTVLTDSSARMEDRAAAYGWLYAFQRDINRALGIRQKGATAQHELTEHLTRGGITELGPLYLAWEAFDVKYPANAVENWTDASVQSALEAIRSDPDTREYVRAVPAHLEIDVPALGGAVHAGSATARALYNELKAKGWRTEGGKRAALKVREVKVPKKGEVAA